MCTSIGTAVKLATGVAGIVARLDTHALAASVAPYLSAAAGLLGSLVLAGAIGAQVHVLTGGGVNTQAEPGLNPLLAALVAVAGSNGVVAGGLDVQCAVAGTVARAFILQCTANIELYRASVELADNRRAVLPGLLLGVIAHQPVEPHTGQLDPLEPFALGQLALAQALDDFFQRPAQALDLGTDPKPGLPALLAVAGAVSRVGSLVIDPAGLHPQLLARFDLGALVDQCIRRLQQHIVRGRDAGGPGGALVATT